MNILSILDELSADNSRLKKESILEREKENELLQQVFKATLDTYTQYYIKKIPEYSPGHGEYSLVWALSAIEDLANRVVTGNAAIEHLVNILQRTNPDDAEVVKRIIGRDLKCGVSVATCNKIWGKDFLPTYPCMLASQMNEKSLANITFPALVQSKMDGMRINILIDADGNVEMRSRNGKLVDLHGKFDNYVQSIMNKKATLDDLDHYRAGVIDGELIVIDDVGMILDRKTGNGILNKAVKGTISDEEASRVRMIAWDLIPMAHFKSGISPIPYFDRLSVLAERVDSVYNIHEKHLIEVIPTEPVDSIEEAQELFQLALDGGEEGILLKNGGAPWEDKRSKHQIKFKAELEADLLVEEWNEGTGRLEGKLGAVTAVSKDGKVRVNVGSGFNDADRLLKPDDIVGKIISVKYNEKIRDKNSDTDSLFLPVFIEVREDKTEADIL